MRGKQKFLRSSCRFVPVKWAEFQLSIRYYKTFTIIMSSGHVVTYNSYHVDSDDGI